MRSTDKFYAVIKLVKNEIKVEEYHALKTVIILAFGPFYNQKCIPEPSADGFAKYLQISYETYHCI